MSRTTVSIHGSRMFSLALVLLSSLMLVAAGCGEREQKPTDPQASVSGTITNNGANVTPKSSVVFFCKEKNATAAGLVDSLGKFSLKPGVSSIGIPAGRYQVMVRAPDPPAPALGTKEYEDFMSGKTKRPEPAKDVPAVLGAFDTSGVSVEVKVGENNFDFDLAKLVKGASSQPVQPAPSASQ